MGILLKLDDSRSELQNRLATELREKAKIKAKESDCPDVITDSQYIKGTKQTTSLAWVWIVLLITAAVLVIWIIANGVAH